MIKGSSGHAIPVVDLFAGPGGLSEGFTAYESPHGDGFDVALSIEMDAEAHRTLEMRSFLRLLKHEDLYDPYIEFLKSGRREEDRDELFSVFPEAGRKAEAEAIHKELGGRAFSKTAFASKVRESIRGRKSWVLVGGPPCQAYSLVGRARRSKEDRKSFESDKKHRLYQHYLEILAEFRPPVFVMENVKGMLSSTLSGHRVLDRMMKDLMEPAGPGGVRYRLVPLVESEGRLYGDADCSGEDFIIRCENYGIPQARHRVIIVGIDADLPVEPDKLRARAQVDLRDVVSDCPPLRSAISRGLDSPREWANQIRAIRSLRFDPEIRKVVSSSLANLKLNCSTGDVVTKYLPGRPTDLVSKWYRRWQLGLLANHESRRHIAPDLRRYFFAACFAEASAGSGNPRSPKLGDFPCELLPAHKNVVKGDPSSSVFADRFRVQVWDRPATTITAHIAKDGHYYIHPDPTQCRSLTVREAARIQTFPDDYVFLGTRTGQYRQVGNAVPPLLAVQLAEIVYGILDRADRLGM